MKYHPPFWLKKCFEAGDIGEKDLRGRIVCAMEHLLGFDTIALPGKDTFSRDQIANIPEADLPRYYNEACMHAVQSF